MVAGHGCGCGAGEGWCARLTAYVGVVGPGCGATELQLAVAEQVGTLIAQQGHVVVTGGMGGVMESACRAAAAAGGMTVGLLPGTDRAQGNRYLTVAIATGLGEMRNPLLVRACDVIVCVGTSWGSLSEVAFAMRTGVPVVVVGSLDIPGMDGPVTTTSPAEAVPIAVALASQRPSAG